MKLTDAISKANRAGFPLHIGIPMLTIDESSVNWDNEFKSKKNGMPISSNITLDQFLNDYYYDPSAISARSVVTYSLNNGWVKTQHVDDFLQWFKTRVRNFSGDLLNQFPKLETVNSYFASLLGGQNGVSIGILYPSLMSAFLKFFADGRVLYTNEGSQNVGFDFTLRNDMKKVIEVTSNCTVQWGWFKISNASYSVWIKPAAKTLQASINPTLTLGGLNLTNRLTVQNQSLSVNHDWDLWMQWTGVYWDSSGWYIIDPNNKYCSATSLYGDPRIVHKTYTLNVSSPRKIDLTAVLSGSSVNISPSSIVTTGYEVKKKKNPMFPQPIIGYASANTYQSDVCNKGLYKMHPDYIADAVDYARASGYTLQWNPVLNENTLLYGLDASSGEYRSEKLSDVLEVKTFKSDNWDSFSSYFTDSIMYNLESSSIISNKLSSEDMTMLKEIVSLSITPAELVLRNKQILSARANFDEQLLNLASDMDTTLDIPLEDRNLHTLIGDEGKTVLTDSGLPLYQVLEENKDMLPKDANGKSVYDKLLDYTPSDAEDAQYHFLKEVSQDKIDAESQLSMIEALEFWSMNYKDGNQTTDFTNNFFNDMLSSAKDEYDVLVNNAGLNVEAVSALGSIYEGKREAITKAKSFAVAFSESSNESDIYELMVQEDGKNLQQLGVAFSNADLQHLQEMYPGQFEYTSTFSFSNSTYLSMAANMVCETTSIVIDSLETFLGVSCAFLLQKAINFTTWISNKLWTITHGDGQTFKFDNTATFDHLDAPIFSKVLMIPNAKQILSVGVTGKFSVITMPHTRLLFVPIDSRNQTFLVNVYLRMTDPDMNASSDLDVVQSLNSAIKGFTTDLNILAYAIYGYPSARNSIFSAGLTASDLVANNFELYDKLFDNVSTSYLDFHEQNQFTDLINKANSYAMVEYDRASTNMKYAGIGLHVAGVILGAFTGGIGLAITLGVTSALTLGAAAAMDLNKTNNASAYNKQLSVYTNGYITGEMISPLLLSSVANCITVGSAGRSIGYSDSLSLIHDLCFKVIACDIIDSSNQTNGIFPSLALQALPDAKFSFVTSAEKKRDVALALSITGALATVVILRKPLFSMSKAAIATLAMPFTLLKKNKNARKTMRAIGDVSDQQQTANQILSDITGKLYDVGEQVNLLSESLQKYSKISGKHWITN